MKYYLTTEGQLVNTKPEAGKGWTIHEIPTDKDGLRAYAQDLLDRQTDLHESIDELVPAPAPVVRDEILVTREKIVELWPSLPLPFRFDLCYEMMEEARKIDWAGTSPPKAKQGYRGND